MMALCKYGDPTCPCQDGDPCHYEGENPMKPPSARAALETMVRLHLETCFRSSRAKGNTKAENEATCLRDTMEVVDIYAAEQRLVGLREGFEKGVAAAREAIKLPSPMQEQVLAAARAALEAPAERGEPDALD